MNGYTIIELIIAIAVALLISVGIISRYQTFDNRQAVKQSAISLKNNLRLAQTSAISGKRPQTGCSRFAGVTISFAVSSYTTQSLCAEGLVGDVDTVTLTSGVSFSPLPSTFTFQSLTGTIGIASPLSVTLTGKNSSYRIQIDPSGRVEEIGFL